jgi:UDP-glucose 4-epimerase
MKVAITGAGGFVGSRFIEYNKEKYSFLKIPLRTSKPSELDLSGVDLVLHLAGKAHEMKAIDEKYISI